MGKLVDDVIVYNKSLLAEETEKENLKKQKKYDLQMGKVSQDELLEYMKKLENNNSILDADDWELIREINDQIINRGTLHKTEYNRLKEMCIKHLNSII